MGYLIHVVLALGTLVVAEARLHDGFPPRPWGLLILAVVPTLLARSSTSAFTRGKFTWASLLGRALHRSAPALFLLSVFFLDWPGTVEAWTGQSASLVGWPEPALCLAFAPFIFFQLLVIDARARLNDTRPEQRAEERSFHNRLFFSALFPFLLYLSVVLVVGWDPRVRARVDGVDLWQALFGTGLLVFFVISLPSIVRNIWRTEPLEPGPQRELLENLAARAGFRCRDLLVWRTGHLMANAAIVGMTPRTRVVLLSDSLLAMLSNRELGAVFAHEIAHALRHHVIIFMLWALAFFMGAERAVAWIVDRAGDLSGQWMPAPVWFGTGLVLGLAVIWYLGFGWLSRRFELEADLKGVELTDDPAALVSALEQVGGRYRDSSGWRHFSTAERVAFVERAHWDPGLGQRLGRALRRWSGVAVVLVLVLGSLELASLLGSYDHQMARVELVEGQTDAAIERLDAAGIAGKGLRSLVAVDRAAAGRPGGLEALALASLTNGDGAQAGDALTLLVMRGREDLRSLAEVFRTWREGGAPPPGAPPDLGEPWAEALRRFHAVGESATTIK
jgi:Zn-dependent protease with chaperone function